MKLHRALWLLLMVLLLAGCGTAAASYGVPALDDAEAHYDPYEYEDGDDSEESSDAGDYEECYDATGDYIPKEDAFDYVWENCQDNIIELVRECYSAEDIFEEEVYEIIDESYSLGYNDASAGKAPQYELSEDTGDDTGDTVNYIANVNTLKFHYPYCSSVDDMKEKNKLYWTGSRDDLVNMGYVSCKRCNP